MLAFLVKREPRSVNAKSCKKYQAHIRNDFDTGKCGKTCSGKELYARIYYFHSVRTGIDVDNLSKPILDALQGKAYANDSQVTLRTSARINLSSTNIEVTEFDIKNIPDKIVENLLDCFDKEEHFMYIEVGKFLQEMIIFGG